MRVHVTREFVRSWINSIRNANNVEYFYNRFVRSPKRPHIKKLPTVLFQKIIMFTGWRNIFVLQSVCRSWKRYGELSDWPWSEIPKTLCHHIRLPRVANDNGEIVKTLPHDHRLTILPYERCELMKEHHHYEQYAFMKALIRRKVQITQEDVVCVDVHNIVHSLWIPNALRRFGNIRTLITKHSADWNSIQPLVIQIPLVSVSIGEGGRCEHYILGHPTCERLCIDMEFWTSNIHLIEWPKLVHLNMGHCVYDDTDDIFVPEDHPLKTITMTPASGIWDDISSEITKYVTCTRCMESSLRKLPTLQTLCILYKKFGGFDLVEHNTKLRVIDIFRFKACNRSEVETKLLDGLLKLQTITKLRINLDGSTWAGAAPLIVTSTLKGLPLLENLDVRGPGASGTLKEISPSPLLHTLEITTEIDVPIISVFLSKLPNLSYLRAPMTDHVYNGLIDAIDLVIRRTTNTVRKSNRPQKRTRKFL